MTATPEDIRASALAARTRAYADKFIAEHDHTEPTDGSLEACFANCARPARPEEYDAIREAIDDRRIELGVVTARHPRVITRRGRPWPKECTANLNNRHDWQTVGPVTACGACGRIEGVDDVAALVGRDGWLLLLPGQLQAHQEGRLLP